VVDQAGRARLLLKSVENHEDVGRPECALSLAQLTREWRAQWRAALISVNFSLQIGTSASSLRIRVRRFDSCRGHRGCSWESRFVIRVAWSSAQRAFVRAKPLETA
jgi:hypothetical protein